jgi:FlaA1/EpsC-like NDP-sugar epimerase
MSKWLLGFLRLQMLMTASALSLVAAFLLRFEFAIPASEIKFLELGLCIFVPVRSLVFCGFRLHRITWRLVTLVDVIRIGAANLAAAMLASTATIVLFGPAFPSSIYVLEGALCFLVTVGLLSSVRLYEEVLRRNGPATDGEKSVLIYGAGAAGVALVHEIRANPRVGMGVAGFLDDDAAKLNACIAGVSVLGAGRDAPRLLARFKRVRKPISEIIIAMPSATGRQMRAATANCRAAGVPFKTVPSLGELLDGKIHTRQLREVSVNDLLGRQPVSIDESKIAETIAGRVVLITGGCGSIGSELSRQVARFNPRKLVILDQAESEMFMLAMELRGRYPSLQLVEEVGDICRFAMVEEVMARHAVEAVFHAAAYKHVPLMEDNPVEAAENNIMGTYNVAEAARRHGVRKFVMISTDKAVNPTSIMGATKRGAELIVSAMPVNGGTCATTYVSVRFGNVLASSGSVVQIFQRQIANGGPVTVTHPEMRRYFMSIPEAVQLVLQASTMGRGSEVFVLDMGEPVAIVDLARNMIRLAGLVPDEDIEIRFTHQRPGEKLFEELRLDREDIVPTFHEKIKVFRSRGPEPAYLREWMGTLRSLLDGRNSAGVRAHLMELVPEYTPTGVDGRRTAPLKHFVPAVTGGDIPWRATAV